MLTNPGDTFGGQSRSQNMVLFDVLGMVSIVCYSKFVRKTNIFDIFDFKNAVTLKTGLGVQRCYCMEISPFNRARGSISCRF